MGWGAARPGAVRKRWAWGDGEWTRAAALCAGQLPLLWLVWTYVEESGQDDYGYGGGGFLGILCVPFLLPLLGLVHATAQIMPAASLARLLPRGVRGPGWAWHLAASVLVGAGWSVLGGVLGDGSVAATLPWCAGAGVLPVLALAGLRGRGWSAWGVWLRSAVACVVLCLVGLPIGDALSDDYVPPALSAGQLAGDWHGGDGAVLRLAPGGRAELTRLPTEGGTGAPDYSGVSEDFVVCDGTGAWTLDRRDRDGVVLDLDGDCGGRTRWTIGGTERDPELFVRFGDPDAGEVRVLTRRD